jgi:uncharacterized damage-inducible protein DinB
MFTRELLREAHRHMEWADATVWAHVPTSGPPDPRLRTLLVHIHTVQRAFLAMWMGRPVHEVFRSPEEFASLDEVRAWGQPVYDEAQAFLYTVSEERLAAPFELPWAKQVESRIGRPVGVSTLGDTCFQVTSHSTYHRGQVNTRLRELGVEPPLVDYIAWIWFGKPVAPWRQVGELSDR